MSLTIKILMHFVDFEVWLEVEPDPAGWFTNPLSRMQSRGAVAPAEASGQGFSLLVPVGIPR